MKAIATLLACSALCAQAPYHFVHLPDTQHYSNAEARYPHWVGICWTIRQWSWPPVYVAHVGDYTENAADIEFQRGNDAMALLGSIPYGVSIGNHDYDAGRKCTRFGGPCTLQWQRWRGAENFTALVTTPAGPLAFLHLEYQPSDAAIEMARDFLELHPTTPAVVVTHYYLDADGGHMSTVGSDFGAAGDNGPRELWEKLPNIYPQIHMVLCGHVSQVVSATTPGGSAFGTTMANFLFNTQSDPDGGNGFFRIYGIDEAAGRLSIATTSTSYTGIPPDRTEAWQLPYDFAGHRARLQTPIRRLEPVADTYVRTHYGGGAVFGNSDMLYCETTNDRQVILLRFDLGAVAACDKAILTLSLEGYQADGDGFNVHRMLRPWSESDSWYSLGGLTAGVDYVSQPDAIRFAPHGQGTLSLDVSDLVRLTLPGPNHGWALVGRGNSSGMRSREWHARTERPLLSIREQPWREQP